MRVKEFIKALEDTLDPEDNICFQLEVSDGYEGTELEQLNLVEMFDGRYFGTLTFTKDIK